MPESVTLADPALPAHRGDRGGWANPVHAAVCERERAAQEEPLATGARVVGRRRILATSALYEPTTREPRGNLPPYIACLNRERRIRELAAVGRFRAANAMRARRMRLLGHRLPPAQASAGAVLAVVIC